MSIIWSAVLGLEFVVGLPVVLFLAVGSPRQATSASWKSTTTARSSAPMPESSRLPHLPNRACLIAPSVSPIRGKRAHSANIWSIFKRSPCLTYQAGAMPKSRPLRNRSIGGCPCSIRQLAPGIEHGSVVVKILSIGKTETDGILMHLAVERTRFVGLHGSNGSNFGSPTLRPCPTHPGSPVVSAW